MKKIIFCLWVALAILTFSLSSCEKGDDYWEPAYSEDDKTENIDIESLVSQNIKLYSSYNDYIWTLRIESTLEDQLPDSHISYSVGHGEKYGEECIVITGDADENETISTNLINGKLVTEIKFPFYYYYVALDALYGIYGPYEGKYTNMDVVGQCAYFMRVWRNLKKKESLTSEERKLLLTTEDILDEFEQTAKGVYTIWVWAVVDGRSYRINTFTFK